MAEIKDGIVYFLMFVSFVMVVLLMWQFMKKTDVEEELEQEREKNADLEAEKEGLENRIRSANETIQEHQTRITDLIRSNIGIVSRKNRDNPSKS